MKRIALWLSSTVTALVLLLSFHTSTSGAGAGATTVQATGTTSTGTAATAASSTYTGSAVSTRFGDVQVQIQVSGGKVVAATAVSYSTRGRDGEINAYAIPVLQQETVAAQSAGIDTVSGATYTSQGYIGSLQSALDQAGL